MKNSNNNGGLFALVDDTENPIRRIPLTQELQREIFTRFNEQQSSLLNNRHSIHFTGSYTVDQSEIFFIDNFPLPEVITQAISNPLNFQILDLSKETHKIKAIFNGIWNDEQKQVNFQVFDNRKLLKKGLTLIGNSSTYKKLEEPGLILPEYLTACYLNEKLYFTSYHNTKQFINLSKYYREATDTELDDFAELELFDFEDKSSFKKNADSIIRKKIALLRKNEVLKDIKVTDIQLVASEFNKNLSEEHHIQIKVNDKGQLIIPKEKKQLKDLIRFLDEDYVIAPLTKRACKTNSKEYL